MWPQYLNTASGKLDQMQAASDITRVADGYGPEEYCFDPNTNHLSVSIVAN